MSDLKGIINNITDNLEQLGQHIESHEQKLEKELQHTQCQLSDAMVTIENNKKLLKQVAEIILNNI